MDTAGPDRDPDIQYAFGHDPRAIRGAREALNEILTDPDDVIADDVRLAASELVTNVVVHTADGGELRAWDPRPDVPLRIEVEDTDPNRPEIPAAPPVVGGRGLTIVEHVSERWGVVTNPDGKVVWAEFDRDERNRTDD